MQHYVYILASKRNGTLYIGSTSGLVKRVWQHKNKLVEGFTKKYGVNKLVHYEIAENQEAAAQRERQLKKWNRAWKIRLIEENNPEWKDLYDDLIENGHPHEDGDPVDSRPPILVEGKLRGSELRRGASVNTMKKSMTSQDAINFYAELQNLGIEIWIDGGWGVDALLEKQTRPHEDLDIVIQQKDVAKARELLEAQGYKDVPRDDTSPWNFVLGDDKGREIDLHVIVLDEKGDGLYGPKEKGLMYPAASLTGMGTIDGHKVKCISPEYVVKFHGGYKLKDKNLMDVVAICEKFGIDLNVSNKNN